MMAMFGLVCVFLFLQDDASLSSADTEASEPSYASETALHATSNEDPIARPESERITPQPLDLKKGVASMGLADRPGQICIKGEMQNSTGGTSRLTSRF